MPIIGIEYVYMHSEQDKEEEEKGMARVVPSKELDSYAVESVKRMVERLGYKRIIMNRQGRRM